MDEIEYRDGGEEGSEEGATFEMHYSWGVRRYDMIQYVARPYLLTADETYERERRGRGRNRERENPLSCWKLVLEFSRNLEYKGCRLASFPRKLAAASRPEQRVIATVCYRIYRFPPTASTIVHMGFASSEYLKRYATRAVLKKMQIRPKSLLCKAKTKYQK